MSKNNAAWQKIFEEDRIVEHIEAQGFYRIAAQRINQEREARLMTKFDHSLQLPEIFKEHNLSIQPITRGDYLIGAFNSYYKLSAPKQREVEYRRLDPRITTLDATNLYSESTALLCALHSGMFAEALEEQVQLTTYGRMSTGSFSYKIRERKHNQQQTVQVNNSQCEIDGGFEGENTFAIVEAKTGRAEDFIIRQLYYPYRLWLKKSTKHVVPIFLCTSNDIFSLYVFQFLEPEEYNSLTLTKELHFCLAEEDILIQDIRECLDRVTPLPEDLALVFPQADKFPRIVDLLGKMQNSQAPVTKEDITLEYAFDPRQTDYYTNAGVYLGLIERPSMKEKCFNLSPQGQVIMSQHPRRRNLQLVECILKRPVFHEVLRRYFELGRELTLEEIMLVLQAVRPQVATDRDWSHSTARRRAQTVKSWVEWILGLTRAENFEENVVVTEPV